jgi:hypothetical protein
VREIDWDSVSAGETFILDYQPNGIFGHGQCFTLVSAEGDDLRQQRNPDGKSAFLFRLEHDRKGPLLIGWHRLLSFAPAADAMK